MKYFTFLTIALMTGAAGAVEMPDCGICAHRGASLNYPENTLAAFREAIWLGAQQIELDVRTSTDGYLVIMHDTTVDRTTNGTGTVASKTLAQLKALDAGSWVNSRFTNERIPTLSEVLSIIPDNVWLNVHMQNDAAESYQAAMEIFAAGREHQAFMSVTAAQKVGALQAAADAGKTILLNNMEGQRMGDGYVQETIDGGFNFLQFLSSSAPPELPTPAQMTALHNAGIKANYYTTQIRSTLDATKKQYVRNMFNAGVDFPLVDDVPGGLSVAAEYSIATVNPHFITNIHPAALGVNVIINPGAETYMDDYHVPTTAALPMSGVLETRDRELTGWNDVVEATNAPYGGLNMPTAAQYPQGTFGKNLFISGIISGRRWMEQTIDLGGLETEIDAGMIEYSLSAWLGGYGAYDNYTALTAIFLDEDAHELASAQLSTQEHEDWDSTTGMVYLDDSGAVPLGSRSVEVRLSFERLTGGITNGMADNLSLVLTQVPEPSTWVQLGIGGLAFLFLRRKKW
jgi:glycerophosphoryl diester phosphodiesterase